jgi:hypothetical protein
LLANIPRVAGRRTLHVRSDGSFGSPVNRAGNIGEALV